jgi:NurA-like 5'-3' nuclease
MEISDRLVKLAVFYDREALRCANARAYFAATVLESAALEAMLYGMCSLFSDDVKRTTIYKNWKFKTRRNRFLEFKFSHLIKIAKELEWFPKKRVRWAGRRGDLADFTHDMRDTRNHIHADKWARHVSHSLNYRKANWETVKEIFEVAHSWLTHNLNKRLLRDIERAEKRHAKNRQ